MTVEQTEISIERQPFPPEYLLDRVEELAVRVYSLTNERDELEMKLAAVTGERDTLRGMLIAERETIEAHRAASNETIAHLVGRMNEAKAQLAAVTAERDALQAQLDQLEHETIIEVGSAIWDRDKAQEENDALRSQLDAVPVQAIAECWRIVSEYHPMHPNTVGVWLDKVKTSRR